jgi:homoserine kinase
MSDRVTVRIPASTSNIGPGFDCLGIALALYNCVTVARSAGPQPVDPPHAMVETAAALFFTRSGRQPFPLQWEVEGDVPPGRGLGSSVTLRLGILAALDALTGHPLGRDGVFRLAHELEGNPDNAAPSTYGGFVLTDARGQSFRFEVAPQLRFVLLIPEFEMLTPEARRVLPPVIAHREAVINSGNACMITAAFATGQYEKLRGCFTDFLHQPYRAPLIPDFHEIIAAGESAGALGGFLSGSGSTVCCVALENAAAAGAAMLAAWPGPAPALVRQVSADNDGWRISA